MSVEVYPSIQLDLEAANKKHDSMNPDERLLDADAEFGKGLLALTSCGTQASLVLHHINKLGLDTSVLFLDTGNYPQETYDFKAGTLSQFWQNRDFHQFGPPPEVVHFVREERLWERDKAIYDWAIKERYLTKAVKELGATALITGVHRDQTENRKDMKPLGLGKDGQVMVRAFVDWTDEKVYSYIEDNHLPTHPLYPERKFVGDINFMDSEEKVECGMHVDENGRLVRGLDPKIAQSIIRRLIDLDPEAPVSMHAQDQ